MSEPDTKRRWSSGRIEGQIDVFEAVEIAEHGLDGRPTTTQLNCSHCGCVWLMGRCCRCGWEEEDDDDGR